MDTNDIVKSEKSRNPIKQSTVQKKSFKGAQNQIERTKARKLKQMNKSKQSKIEAKRPIMVDATVAGVMKPQKTKSGNTIGESFKSELLAIAPDVECPPKRRPKTHFRKSKKPGRV